MCGHFNYFDFREVMTGMEELLELKRRLSGERPESWDNFPDIGLYKDQVVTYMQRQLISFSDEEQLTSAMINNYIKDRLLPRADGKKYNKEHLARLTEILVLKQVLSVKNAGVLLESELEGSDQERFYDKFRTILDEALTEISGLIDCDWDYEALSDAALKLAITSYARKLACERLLDIIISKREAGLSKRAEKPQDDK